MISLSRQPQSNIYIYDRSIQNNNIKTITNPYFSTRYHRKSHQIQYGSYHVFNMPVPRMELSPSTRSRICSLRTAANWTYGQIQAEYPYIPRSTIITTCRREAIRGSENQTLNRSGRPRILTETERDMIYDAIQEIPSIKHEALLDLVDHKITRETLRRLLKELGLRKSRKIKRPMLTEDHAR